jgi:hypothetical protein
MITINRGNEVLIEDGYTRATVNPDGSGYLHTSEGVYEITLHDPQYLNAAKDAGMAIPEELIAKSRAKLDAEYFGEE